MWKKIKEILCKHTAYIDESTTLSGGGTRTASIIDLGPSLAIPSRRTEAVHHYEQPYGLLNTSNLNKNVEHCRSLFNLIPTSLRSRRHQHRQVTNKLRVDASTITDPLTETDKIEIDYDSGYMSENFLNRTSSYSSCYSTIATVTPIASINRYGSIENLLYGHTKSNPASISVVIRKHFQPFAQAHVAVTKGMIVTGLYSRGPWIYIRINSTGKTGYVPRIICSLYHNRIIKNNDNSMRKMSTNHEKCLFDSNKQQKINRYLSHSSAIIDDNKSKQKPMFFDERERRHTYTLPRLHRTNLLSTKSCSLTSNTIMPTRDSDSSSTQDSGYSESTPFFLVQQPINSMMDTTEQTIHHSVLLKVPDSINPTQPNQQKLNFVTKNRSTLLNDSSKRHSFGAFDINQTSLNNNNSIRRQREFALIRNVRRDRSPLQIQDNNKTSFYNLPKSHVQIPASIILNHHRQKQLFGSSHSAFRPVQPKLKHKRASSEGHSPTSISLSSSTSSVNVENKFSKRRRLSCDLPIPLLSKLNSNSTLSRSVCDHSASIKLNDFSRTMSDILCDQFSELNIDAIEKDSLICHNQPKKLIHSKQCLYTVIKDYHSSRGSFAVKRGDFVYLLKQIGRACYLVRKQNNGQIGFIPKALLIPATSSRIDTFLQMNEGQETII